MLMTNRKLLIVGAMAALVSACSAKPKSTLDTSFGSNGIVSTPVGAFEAGAQSVSIQGDGKIVVAGYTKSFSGETDFAVARYTADGTLDTSFNGDGLAITSIGSASDTGMSVAVQEDGKIVVVGYTGPVGSHDFAVVRYNTDGFLDPSFGSTGVVMTSVSKGDDEAMAVAVQPDGKVIAVGAQSGSGWGDIAITRYDANGNLDTGYGENGVVITHIDDHQSAAQSAVLQKDGKLVVAGQVITPNDKGHFVFVRYSDDAAPPP